MAEEHPGMSEERRMQRCRHIRGGAAGGALFELGSGLPISVAYLSYSRPSENCLSKTQAPSATITSTNLLLFFLPHTSLYDDRYINNSFDFEGKNSYRC